MSSHRRAFLRSLGTGMVGSAMLLPAAAQACLFHRPHCGGSGYVPQPPCYPLEGTPVPHHGHWGVHINDFLAISFPGPGGNSATINSAIAIPGLGLFFIWGRTYFNPDMNSTLVVDSVQLIAPDGSPLSGALTPMNNITAPAFSILVPNNLGLTYQQVFKLVFTCHYPTQLNNPLSYPLQWYQVGAAV